MTVPTTTVPTAVLFDGPAAGHRPVFPDLHGRPPAHLAITEPYDESPWLLDCLRPDDPHPPTRHYRHDATTGGYLYVGALPATPTGRPLCPRCGPTHPPTHPGWCLSCVDFTHSPLYAALTGTHLPRSWAGRWAVRSGVDRLRDALPAGLAAWRPWPTGRYVANHAGAVAEVFATAAEPAPAVAR